MDKLDPQVQIRIIDLAEKWSDAKQTGGNVSEDSIKRQAKLFDQAYKAIIKTLTEK